MKKAWIFIVVLLFIGVGYIWFSPMFEKNPPKINIYTNGFINFKKPIKIEINDDSGIKSYEIILKGKNFEKIIAKSAKPNLGKKIVLNVTLPKVSDKQIVLKVMAIDISKWHFFKGNKTQKKALLNVDTTYPDAEVINNSYAIGRGGSAVAIVKVSDENLKDAYILVNKTYKFKLTPFVKKGYYISLLAWPITENMFDAELIAIDKAGNKTQTHIPYYWRKYRYPHKKLNITDNFINSVSKRVIEKMGMQLPNDLVEIFKLENETIRKINENEIKKLTTPIRDKKIINFYMYKFNPLPGSAKEAGFGEFRDYYYKGKVISHAIHKGIDLAKIKHAKIFLSNKGTVIAKKYIGIYGNTLIIYHKLGLYSLYSHTSAILINENQKVNRGVVIARTGSTGGVFGDHLHFGLYIQGIAVNPIEWMDYHWIKTNITNIIRSAKRIIIK